MKEKHAMEVNRKSDARKTFGEKEMLTKERERERVASCESDAKETGEGHLRERARHVRERARHAPTVEREKGSGERGGGRETRGR